MTDWQYAHEFEDPCPVTGRDDMIDDCYITIEFGFGSDKDMTTYNLGPVHDSVGKKVLETIQSLMSNGNSIDKFATDHLAEMEANQQPMTDQQKAEWGFNH